MLLRTMIIICLTLTSSICMANTVILRYASPYPATHTFSRADQTWMNWVNTQSNNTIQFKTFWGGSLISSDMNMLEIKYGVSDIGLISPIYTKGGTHLIRTQAGFYGGVQNIDDQVQIYKCLEAASPQLQQELSGLKVLAVQGGNFPEVLTINRPIKSLEDFKGLRLRVQSEATEILKQLGADPVNMPMGETYSALAKGIIDGVVGSVDALASLHFAEVAKHFTHIKFSRGAYPARAISLKKWQMLSKEHQAILEASQTIWENALKHEILKAKDRGQHYGEENGITFYSFPEDQQHEFDTLFNAIALEQAKSLQSIGIDAEPTFHLAQQLIKQGSPVSCQYTN